MGESLNDPWEFQQFVEALVEARLSRHQMRLSPSGLAKLIEPRLLSAVREPIDPGRLRTTLVPIIEIAAQEAQRDGPGELVEPAHLERAMERTGCHYLWFC